MAILIPLVLAATAAKRTARIVSQAMVLQFVSIHVDTVIFTKTADFSNQLNRILSIFRTNFQVLRPGTSCFTAGRHLVGTVRLLQQVHGDNIDLRQNFLINFGLKGLKRPFAQSLFLYLRVFFKPMASGSVITKNYPQTKNVMVIDDQYPKCQTCHKIYIA